MRVAAPGNASSDQRGFSLLEVMVAAVIAVIAVVGLAYSFSTGRGLIDRYATARDALAAAEQRLERLTILSIRDPANADLSDDPPDHGPFPRQLNGSQSGSESWRVTWVNDPADDNPSDPNPNDYKRITVVVGWTQGGLQDQVALSSVLMP